MTSRTAWQLGEFLEEWASAAVATQRLFDQHAESSPAVPRMRMDTFEADIDLRLSVSRSTEFEFRVTPLNLGYRAARRHSESGSARLRFRITQGPPFTPQGA